jgi:hypothetical protein
MKDAPAKDALKITHQIRPRGADTAMTYGLECQGVILTLVVAPRSSDHDPGAWRVDARAKTLMKESVTASEWGSSRIEALRAVGRAWDAARSEHGLRMFDWNDVARVLEAVRAV